MLDRIVIRDYRKGDPISQITALLHAAYAQLAAMGLRYLATHQDDTVTRDRLETGHAVVAELDGKIIATVTLYAPSERADANWFRLPGVFKFGQFGVHPDHQRHGLGLKLMQHIEDLARQRGARELACDTAEPAHHLRAWYERMGYRFIEYASWSITNYRSVILSKRLVD